MVYLFYLSILFIIIVWIRAIILKGIQSILDFDSKKHKPDVGTSEVN